MHLNLSAQDVGSREKRGAESRRGPGGSEGEDVNFYWRGLERLTGRDRSLITVVSVC